MLPNHAPLRIVEAFRLLEALHPGRIDLGLGRAPGTDTVTAYAMRRSVEALSGDDYPELLAELLAFDDRSFPEGHPFRDVEAVPHDVRLPPLWLLGSSGFSAQLAAGAGLGFAFAAHINGAGAVPALRNYRERFVPSARYPAPWAILTVAVAVGEDAAHGRELARAYDLFLLRLASGQRGGRPTLEEARRHQFTPAERALLASVPMRYLAGDAASVREQLTALADEAGADEVMLTTFLAEPDERRRAIAHLARAFGLRERPAAGAREPVAVD
jgi:luciferase family oxidoreductase group 1